VLRCVLAYEQRNWIEAQHCVPQDLETIARIYQEAVAWSVRNLSALSERKRAPNVT